jgi:hypothetical protein
MQVGTADPRRVCEQALLPVAARAAKGSPNSAERGAVYTRAFIGSHLPIGL